MGTRPVRTDAGACEDACLHHGVLLPRERADAGLPEQGVRRKPRRR
jgi:hypothetical protein